MRTRLRPRSRLWLGAIGLGGFFAASYVAASPAAFTFAPPNPGWVPVTNNGVPIGDVEGDVPGPRDIVGDAANPMLFVAADATHVYFRLRVDSTPLQNATNFTPFGWGCFINTDDDLQTYEFSTIIDGVAQNDPISFYRNTTTTAPNSPNDDPDLPAVSTVTAPLTGAVGHAQVTTAGSMFGGDADFFISWAVERSAAESAGYIPGQPASFYCGSSNSGTKVDADCSGTAACQLEPLFSDPITCDETGCAACGDGVTQSGEGCDDGNLNPGDGCGATCLVELTFPCVDGGECESAFCDAANNTCACDEAADCLPGQMCNQAPNPNVCVTPGCGNGVVDAGEGCDDTNLTPGDGCGSTCLIELTFPCTTSPGCESGLCDTGNVCACNEDVDCDAGEVCNAGPDPNECVLAGCGNDVLESGEGCDDGGTANGDGCNEDCLLELGQPCGGNDVCASGFCDATGGPAICACDDDGDCGAGQQCNPAPDPNLCIATGCGNGVIDAGEGCDDNNANPGDGCNALCLIELTFDCDADAECASGFCDPADTTCACDQDADCPLALICDESTDPNTCVTDICGDGSIDGAEGCDDQNTDDGDGCSATCTVEDGWQCTGEPSDCEPAPCDDDTDCIHCNEQFDVCVPECTVDEDCPTGFFCDELSGLCVPLCDEATDCPGAICDPTSGECVQCIEDDDCPRGETCSDENICGPECDEDPDCPGELVCDEPQGICVECVLDEDCEAGLSCIDNQCLPACNEEADCDGVPCNETTGICVECETDADCPDGEVCDEPVNQCVECVADRDCASGVCNEPLNECVECVTDGDCPDGVCDETVNECVECLEDADCPDGVCDETSNQCVECVTDEDCPEESTCDTATNNCVPDEEGCQSDEDCPADEHCEVDSGECVECLVNEHCDTFFCDTTTNTCSECDEDADCDSNRVCDVPNGECILPVDEGTGFFPQGNGFLGCSTEPGRSSPGLVFAFLGLLGLGVARSRRRR